MPTAEEFADKILSRLRRHRLEATEAAGLLAAAFVVARLVTPLPLSAAACALAAAALAPARHPKAAASRLQAFLAGMARRLVLFAAIGAAWLFLWNLPATCLWVGPVWFGLAGAAALNWAPVVARVREAGAWLAAHRSARAEGLLRILLLAALPFWLMRGFLVRFLQGGADAAWYGAVLADTVEQARSGVFPVWVGQGAHQFNGAVSPVRIAPAFNYLGILLDAATFHSLGAVALLNLLLTAVALVAALCAYACLGALLPRNRWLAAGLAVLFMSCPGVLGLAYNGDLFMSWMTLPLVPVVFLGTVLSFRPETERRALLMLGASLGLCWWGHPPIALWATLLAGAAQVARIALLRGKGPLWGAATAGALIFGAIAAYPIGSVLLYPTQPGAHMSEVQLAYPGTIAALLRDAYPGALLPMSANGHSPGDVQLGYALWALLLFCLYNRLRGARLEVRVLLLEAALLSVLLLPIPGVSRLAWTLVPPFIRNPTGNWAAPRLYLPLAAATVFAAAAAGRRRGAALSALVAGGCLWSLFEAGKFAVESRVLAPDPVATIDRLRPENLQLTRYSYGMFPTLPSTFTHGVTDPLLENHLLPRDPSAPVLENAKAAFASGTMVASAGFVKRRHGDSDFIELDRTLRIEPGRSYLLQLVLERPEFAVGVLQIEGPGFFREYGLPEHGGSRAFGVGGEHLGFIPVWTTGASAEDLRVRFFPSPPVTMDQGLRFASEARLLAYDPGRLPVVVESWIPYAARVRSPAAALLETPRMFQPGYEALVDGKPAPVSKSPDGFACVAVPAGQSHVTLSYVAPAGLRALFWLSFLGIACAGVAAALAWLFDLLAARRAKWAPEGAGG